MKRFSFYVSAMAFMGVAVMGFSACEDDTGGPSGEFGGLDAASSFDAPATTFEAGAVDASTDRNDPSDASDGDASDGDASTMANETALLGRVGGASYDDTCPAGQVMIGAEGGGVTSDFYTGVLSKFRVLCGTPKAPAGGSTVVTIEPGGAVPATAADAHGTVPATAAQVVCPVNQVVVGFQGKTVLKDFPPVAALPAYFEMLCAPLSASNGAVTIGTSASGGGVGTNAGTSAGPLTCAGSTISVGMRVHSGQIVDGLIMRCDAPGIP